MSGTLQPLFIKRAGALKTCGENNLDKVSRKVKHLYRTRISPYYKNQILPNIDLRKPEAGPGFFSLVLFIGVIGFFVIASDNSLSGSDKAGASGAGNNAQGTSSNIPAHAAMKMNLINFAGYILDLPDEAPGGRYDHALQSLVLDYPEVLTSLKMKDVSRIFTDLKLSQRVAGSNKWQFSSPYCVLDVYFVQENPKLGENVVAHYDIRSQNNFKLTSVFGGNENAKDMSEKEAQSKCLRSIVDHSRDNKENAPRHEGETVSTQALLKAG